MKVLITGCNGQLGTELQKILKSGASELGVIPDYFINAEITAIDLNELDIAAHDAALEYVKNCAPDVIFNCAAYTNVDGCETHEDETYRANAIGPRNLAEAAAAVNAKIMHVSTDYVFAGDDPTPRKEYDLPNPISVYGKTKLAGETAVKESCKRYFILRTAWLYGYTGKNFVRTMMRLGHEQGSIRVVNDQFGNPTNAADLAFHMLKIAATDYYGIYHCTGGGTCSWYDFAARIIEYSGINAKVSACTTQEYNSPTKRPAYSSLDHMMLRCTVGDGMRPWEEALKYFMEHDPQK